MNDSPSPWFGMFALLVSSVGCFIFGLSTVNNSGPTSYHFLWSSWLR